MARFLTSLLLVLLFTVPVFAIDYQLDVELFPQQKRLIATAVIAPVAPLPSQFELLLADSCEVVAVHQAGQPSSYTHRNGVLSIKASGLDPITISYRGSFTDHVDGVPVHNEDPSYGVAAGISTDGTFLSAQANWYPRLKHGNIHYRVAVSAPAGVEAVTSGRRIARETTAGVSRSVWQVDYPIYGITLSAGNYQVYEDSTGATPIYAYFYPASAQLADVYLKEARNYLDLYEKLFGPYPFYKFAIVENFFPTGYGFPSWTLLGSSVIRLPFIVKTSLGHEIAHSWWGTGVKVDYQQGNWAEGLTTYVADYLYKERNSAAEAREYRLKVLRDYAGLVNTTNDFPLSQFMSRNDKASQAIGYGKSAMFFHMLRQRVGDELFWDVLRKIATEKMFQTLSWSDFERQFSSAAGFDLQPFFVQWLKRTAGPKLSLKQVEATKKADHYLVEGELLQEAPYYQLSLDLVLASEENRQTYPIKISTQAQRFTIETDQRPLSLSVDPEADLFRILAKEEIPPTVNSVRASNNLLAISADQLTPSVQATKTLLGAFRKADLPLRPADNLTSAEIMSHDLLVFGVADKLRPAEKFFADESAAAGMSTFIVLPHPTAKDRIAAWFVSGENQSDAVVARKIPHYGKYSHLVFEGSTNQLKQTLPPPESPLLIEFSWED